MLDELQRVLSRMIIISDDTPKHLMRKVCGVDVSYYMNKAFCSAVIMNRYSWEIFETKESMASIGFPYISGYFMLREAGPIFMTLKKLKSSFDVLIVNGHGILHPRRMGLASFVGLLIEKPTIGIAKRLLCGTENGGGYLSINNHICGKKIAGDGHNYIYVSVGHKISLETSIELVYDLFKRGANLPEPLNTADHMSKRSRSSYLSRHKGSPFQKG
jgi:deoxyribonuclease V